MAKTLEDLYQEAVANEEPGFLLLIRWQGGGRLIRGPARRSVFPDFFAFFCLSAAPRYDILIITVYTTQKKSDFPRVNFDESFYRN